VAVRAPGSVWRAAYQPTGPNSHHSARTRTVPTGAIVGLAIGGSIVGCLGIVGIVGCIVGGVMLYRKRKAEGGAQYQSTLESGEAILGTGNGDDDEDEEDQEDDEL